MSLPKTPSGNTSSIQSIVNSTGVPVAQRLVLQLPASIVATDDTEKEATVLTFTSPTPAFSPDQIVGLVRWHEGDTGLLATSWADKSPVGSALDQVNGTMTLNAGINGIPGITGSGGNFLFCSRADVAADAARTIFVVHAAAAGNNGLYMTRSQTGYCLHYGTDQAIIESNNVLTQSMAGNGSAGNHISEAVFGGITGNNVVYLVDGVAKVITSSGTGVGTEVGSADTRVGRTAGTVCAILVYNSALSAGNRALVRAYLASKFAISAA